MLNQIKELINKNNKNQQWLLNNCLFLTIAGSRLYGTNTEISDYDIRGAVISPESYWIGANTFEQFECKNENIDIVIYDIRKWIRLTINGNPNILEILYVPNNNPNVIVTSDEWNWIKDSVKQLVNQNCYMGYHGYSLSQIKKMTIKQSNKTGRQYITEKMGFDTKFASHAFRLIRQGRELLKTGNITFPRPDAEDLLNIRNGIKYGPNDLNKCLEEWEEENQSLTKAYEKSILPKKYDFERYDSLLRDIFYQQVFEI